MRRLRICLSKCSFQYIIVYLVLEEYYKYIIPLTLLSPIPFLSWISAFQIQSKLDLSQAALVDKVCGNVYYSRQMGQMVDKWVRNRFAAPEKKASAIQYNVTQVGARASFWTFPSVIWLLCSNNYVASSWFLPWQTVCVPGMKLSTET